MARNTQEILPQNQTRELRTIESLAEKLAVPDWAMAGMMAAYGWGEGKEMAEEEFGAAMQMWLSGPMHREV